MAGTHHENLVQIRVRNRSSTSDGYTPRESAVGGEGRSASGVRPDGALFRRVSVRLRKRPATTSRLGVSRHRDHQD